MNNLSHDQMQSFVSDLYAAIKAREDAHKKTQVFGAIRRAAKVARRYDCECLFPGHNSIPRGQAAVVRQAIRAAIGSDKS